MNDFIIRKNKNHGYMPNIFGNVGENEKPPPPTNEKRKSMTIKRLTFE